jgi:hypothetical protein
VKAIVRVSGAELQTLAIEAIGKRPECAGKFVAACYLVSDPQQEPDMQIHARVIVFDTREAAIAYATSGEARKEAA